MGKLTRDCQDGKFALRVGGRVPWLADVVGLLWLKKVAGLDWLSRVALAWSG